MEILVYSQRHIQHKISVQDAVFHLSAFAPGCLFDIGKTVTVSAFLLCGKRLTVRYCQAAVKAVAYTEQKLILADSRLHFAA